MKTKRKKGRPVMAPPDRTRWVRVHEFEPPLNYEDEDSEDLKKFHLAQEVWQAEGKRFPRWMFNLWIGGDTKNRPGKKERGKDFFFEIDVKRSRKDGWKSGVDILTIPAVIAWRFSVFLRNYVEVEALHILTETA